MRKYKAWMYDDFGYRFAFIVEGDYNVLTVYAERLALSIGARFDWLEEIKD